MSHEQLPEDKLNQAVAEAAAKELFNAFAKENKLSMADDVWQLPREEIAAARAKAAARGLGVAEILTEFPEDAAAVDQAKVVVDYIFDEMIDNPLPRTMLDVKKGETLDHRDELIPILPGRLEEQLVVDFMNYKDGWNDPNEFDIEL